jgi:hypothetical protein
MGLRKQKARSGQKNGFLCKKPLFFANFCGNAEIREGAARNFEAPGG